jgi:hypothetical protein
MTFTARFGSAQTALGYQFVDSSGALIGARVTSGIIALPEAGSYAVTPSVPGTAVWIFWTDTVSQLEILDPVPVAPDVPTAAAIADAVCDEVLSGHTATGSAGAALGRLLLTPPDAPVIIITDPAGDVNDCVVWLDTQEIDNTKTAGVVIKVRLSGPAQTASGVAVGYGNERTAVTGEDGRATITLERTDRLTPATRTYRIVCEKYGIYGQEVALAADTFNLATLVPAS